MQLNSVGYNFCVFAFVFLALGPNGSCRNGKTATMSQEQNRVAPGNWGGQNARLEVTNSGAQVQFSCSKGSIEQPLTLDQDGNFSAKGTFVKGEMGPTREDNPPKSQPAIYNGVVHDKSMTLTVTLTETNEKVGTFNLEQGNPGRIWRCH